MLVRTARRPDEEEVEKMVRDTMINIDRVGGSSAGGDAVLEAMVRGTGQEAFADATMLLSDVTVLTTKSEPPKDTSPEQKTSDSGAGAVGNNTEEASSASETGKGKPVDTPKWFDRDSSVNALRRGLRNSLRILTGSWCRIRKKEKIPMKGGN